ncbi:MAG: hypothetical protein AABX73_00540 [Nanoarchaeota archaeon]
MAEISTPATNVVAEAYRQFITNLGPGGALIINVLVTTILLAIVSLFIFEFYNSTAKKNILRLNLKKYNRSNHPVFSKLLASLFYLIEYIIIIPFVIILWFAALSIIFLLITDPTYPLDKILLIAASVISAVRLLAYHNNEISKELAKLFPFIALSVFLLAPGGLNSFANLLNKFNEIPNLFNNLFYYVIAIVILEILLRVFYTIYAFVVSEDERELDKEGYFAVK